MGVAHSSASFGKDQELSPFGIKMVTSHMSEQRLEFHAILLSLGHLPSSVPYGTQVCRTGEENHEATSHDMLQNTDSMSNNRIRNRPDDLRTELPSTCISE